MARVYYQHMTQAWSLKRHKSDNSSSDAVLFWFFKAFCQGCLYLHLLIIRELDHWRHRKMHLAAAFLHHYRSQGLWCWISFSSICFMSVRFSVLTASVWECECVCVCVCVCVMCGVKRQREKDRENWKKLGKRTGSHVLRIPPCSSRIPILYIVNCQPGLNSHSWPYNS